MTPVKLPVSNKVKLVQWNPSLGNPRLATWCGPCRQFAPVFEAASEQHEDVAFAKCDTDAQTAIAGHFNIKSIPTLAIFREQVLLFLQAGSLPPEGLEDVLRQVRELDMDKVRAEIAAEQESAGEEQA